MIKLLIYGTGGHAGQVLDIIRDINLVRESIKPIGFLDYLDPNKEKEKYAYGLPVIGDENVLESNDIGADAVFIAVGNNDIREEIHKRCLDINPAIFTVKLIHPSAHVSETAKIGHGTMVGPLAIINHQAVIKRGCIINSGTIIEHNCHIDEFSNISPGATLCGFVQVRKKVFVGANAVVKQQVVIEKEAIVGAGSTILKKVPQKTTVYGVH
jgi:sugar O-acyltransferase (sialic acid O-acetyltransferase NeuD family)